MYKYSKTTNTFYPIEFIDDYSDLPNDLVDVDESVFIEFTQQPPVGTQRGSNSDGYPSWIKLPPPAPLTQAKLESSVRLVRDEFLVKTDKMLTLDYTIRDVRLTDEKKSQLIQVRDEFKQWPSSSDFPNLERLPDMPLWIFNEAISAGWNAPKLYVPSELLELYELLS